VGAIVFESLKTWFFLEEKESLFEHADEAAIHVALSSLLYHIMGADHKTTKKERKVFNEILSEEFGLNTAQADKLYEFVSLRKSDLQSDLEIVSHYLKKTPTMRLEFMKKLNKLVNVDGVQTEELEIFYKAMGELFPEVIEKLFSQ